MKKFLFSILVFCSLIFADFVFASAPFTDGFDSWTGGVPAAIPNAGWSNTECSVAGESYSAYLDPIDGNRLGYCYSSSSSRSTYKNGDASNVGFWDFFASAHRYSSGFVGYISLANTGNSGVCGRLRLEDSTTADFVTVSYYNDGSWVAIGDISEHDWSHFGVMWDFSDASASNRWIRYWVGANSTAKIYNPEGNTCTGVIGSFYFSSAYGEVVVDSLVGYEVGASSYLDITKPVASETSSDDYFDFDYGTQSYDSAVIYVCYGATAANAENCDSYVDHKVIGICDDTVDSYYGNTSISYGDGLGNPLISGNAYYAKAYLYASNKVEGYCLGNDFEALRASSDTVYFIYDSSTVPPSIGTTGIGWVDSMLNALSSFFTTLFSGEGFIGSIADGVGDAISGLTLGLATAVNDAILAVGAAVPDISGYLLAISNFVQGLGEGFPQNILDAIGDIGELVPDISPIITAIGNAVPDLSPVITAIGEAVPDLSGLITAIGEATPSITSVIDGIGDIIYTLGESTPNVFNIDIPQILHDEFIPVGGFNAAFGDAWSDIQLAAASQVPFCYFSDASDAFGNMTLTENSGSLFVVSLPVNAGVASTTIEISAMDTNDGSAVRDVFDIVRPYINIFMWLAFGLGLVILAINFGKTLH